MTTSAEIKSDLDLVQRRLEREHQSVSRLLTKIRSYRLEPKDYNCFQLMQQLRFELRELMHSQQDVLLMIKTKRSSKSSILEDAEALFLRFTQTQKHMAEYMLKMS